MKTWPSVTQVLSPWQDFSNVPPARLQEAADRGAEIHKICAAIALGLWVPNIPENCMPYVDSFCLWFPVVEEVVAVEERLYCQTYKFKGRLDFVGKIRGDKGLTLIDFKSPVAQNKGWPLQVAAYRHLALEKWSDITRVASLQLSPKGKIAKLREYTGEMERHFALFLNALSIYKYFRKEN